MVPRRLFASTLCSATTNSSAGEAERRGISEPARKARPGRPSAPVLVDGSSAGASGGRGVRARRRGPGLRDEGGPGHGGGGGSLGGDPPGRAGEAERQPLPAVEEEAGGAEQGPPAPPLARGRQGPRQGAAAGLHPEGGLRGAHRQVRLLHHRHHGPQGDRLSVPGRELLERLHHHGAHRLPEQARPRGLQEPPRGRRAGRRRRPRPTPRPRPLSPRPARNAAAATTAKDCTSGWKKCKPSCHGLNHDRIPMKENKEGC